MEIFCFSLLKELRLNLLLAFTVFYSESVELDLNPIIRIFILLTNVTHNDDENS